MTCAEVFQVINFRNPAMGLDLGEKWGQTRIISSAALFFLGRPFGFGIALRPDIFSTLRLNFSAPSTHALFVASRMDSISNWLSRSLNSPRYAARWLASSLPNEKYSHRPSSIYNDLPIGYLFVCTFCLRNTHIVVLAPASFVKYLDQSSVWPTNEHGLS